MNKSCDRCKTPNPVRASIITVNFRVPERVKSLIESLEKHPPSGEWETIIVDNSTAIASESELIKELVESRSNAKLISPGENIGFAAGNNLAVPQANGEYLIFLNPDIVVAEGCIDRLIGHLGTCPECGIAAPRVSWGDGGFQPSGRTFPNPLTGIFGRATILSKLFPKNPLTKRQLIDLENANEPVVVDWAAGMAWAVRKDEFIRAGGWDERFFLYWEDADMAMTYLKQLGLRTHYIPTARVIHYHAASSSHAGPRATRIFHESAYRYVAKNIYPAWYDPRRWLSWLALKFRANAIILKDRLKG